MADVRSLRDLATPGFMRTSAAGKSVNDRMKATTMPMGIMYPKSMTGLIPLTISEPKATMVVSAVNRQGSTIRRMVLLTSHNCSASGFAS